MAKSNSPLPVKDKVKRKPSAILNCTCIHAFQDERYGAGRRLHNFGSSKDVYTCTVCANSKPGLTKLV